MRRRSHNRAGLGDAVFLVYQLGNAEVHQVGVPVLVKHNVGGLYIAVNHATAVGVVQRIGQVTQQVGYVLQRHALVFQLQHPVAQAAALQQPHGDVGHVVVGAIVIDGHNVAVFQ